MKSLRVAVALALAAGCSSTTNGTNPPPADAGVADAGGDSGAKDAGEDSGPEDAPPPATGVVAPSGIGEPCESAESGFPPTQGSCAAGQLCLGAQLGFRNGYCVSVCQGTRCPGDATCTRLQGFPVCMRTCTANDQCRASDGYVCTAAEGGAGRVCNLNDAPEGARPDGSACFTRGGGAHPLPAMPTTVFGGRNLSASGERRDSFLEAEGNVAVHPTMGRVAVSYIGAGTAPGGGSQIFMGVTSSDDGVTFSTYASVNDPTLNSTSDPVLDWGTDGVLRMTFIGLARNSFGQVLGSRVRVTESTDNGRTWAPARAVDPTGYCPQTGNGICDKPWITTGPGVEEGSRYVYIGYLSQRVSGGSQVAELVAQRSEDGGMTWSAPSRLAQLGFSGTVALTHNLVQIATGANGLVGFTWTALSAGNGASGPAEGTAVRFGSRDNRVFFRRSRDGLRSTETSRVVSRPTDSPVYIQPPVALDGADTVHVVYVTGDSSGAWDLILATSGDGGQTWQHRQVNDEPERCATHWLPAMVVDPTTHDVHVVWLDNRFGDGQVSYARCPGDPTMPCGRNELVSNATFNFTTSRSPQIWHGDYIGLAITASGELWPAWSDTRTGAPAMYLARGSAR